MTTSEKLCLQWNEFQNIVIGAFEDLRNDGDLTDVTLACEDGKQIETHKIVLAATSPFFLDILRRNKHPHPLIYMKGVKSENLVAMVEFFYRGEANVSQENLDDFLALADEMRLKGLSKLDESQENTRPNQIQTQGFEPRELPLRHKKASQKVEKSKDHSMETALALNNSVEVTDMRLLNQQIRSMMETGHNRVQTGSYGKIQERITRVCKVCGKEGRQNEIKNHIEAKHITGLTHSCDICGNKAKTKISLMNHKSKYHRQEVQ